MHTHEFEIELGENKLTLSFDMTGFSYLEEELGKKMSEMTEGDIFDTESATGFVRMLWAFSKTNHPDLTKHDIGKMVHIGNIKDIVDNIYKKYEASMPEKDDKKKSKKKEVNKNHLP